MGTFNGSGILIWTGDLLYRGSPVRSTAVDGKFIWCAVPNHNSIIRYSPSLRKVDFRIGGTDSNTFSKPMAVFNYDNTLYISNKNSCSVNCVDLSTYVVSDYKHFEEPVLRFFKVDDSQVAVLSSGVYIL
jgi:hypothetical protein